jgi:alpha-N-arabinofuranosidase
MALKARVSVHADQKLGMVRPELYGHFAEHLGGCIYDGIWVGENSDVPNDGGIRLDTVEALRDIKAPVIRWPGGCFADDYHWEDGIGPRDQRPRRVNLWWGGEESNHFGTDEFVRFCRLVGAEPYICLNVGSGTPLEAKSWLEYCNYAGDSHYTSLRAGNGNPEPFNVRWWAVGNENWGCGGRLQPEEYAREYRRFACFLRGRGLMKTELIGCGHTTPDWNRRFLTAMGCWDLMDHISIHRYYHRGHQTDFTEDDYYGLYAEASHVDDDIRATAGALDDVVRGSKFIGIILDEWGVWHREAARDGLGQINTHRDALAAAGVLDTLNRWCDRVVMGNIAQTINVLQCLIHTDGERLWKTPTCHVFDLYQAHMGNTAVEAVVDAPAVTATRGDGRETDVPLLSVSASMAADGSSAALTLTNRSMGEPMICRLDWVSIPEPKCVSARCLAHFDPSAHNTAKAPAAVTVRPMDMAAGALANEIELPPLSVTAVEVAC